MNKIYYQIYHANLAFSAIPEEQLSEVIDKCYVSLLDFVEKTNTKIGLEISGYSLEIIKNLRPSWIEKFKEFHTQGLIELIGSGYMQIIGPLVPYEVNIQNQLIGLKVYKEILGITPIIAFVNEQTFSSSLIDIYTEAGYKAIIMEWNNAYAIHKEWSKEFSYSPVLVKGLSTSIPIIWSDSILFQQFQRSIHNETTQDEYLSFLENYLAPRHKIVSIYSSDLEIFNYRPGRFETEATILEDEWGKIRKVSTALKQAGSFVLPSELLPFCDTQIELSLTNAKSPIIVKKQDKYSLSRWAACGRGAVYINTLCYRFFKSIQDSKDISKWKKLLTFWGSDYRTHITLDKWNFAIQFLSKFQFEENNKPTLYTKNCNYITQDEKYLRFEKDGILVIFKLTKGLCLHGIFKNSKQLPIGTVKHGELDFINHGADYFTGNTVIESSASKKITDLVQVTHFECFELGENTYKIETTLSLKHNIELLKSWTIDCTNNSLSLDCKLSIPDFVNGYIRCGTITFLPNLIKNFNIEFKNGGQLFEHFDLNNVEINQHATASLIQSSTGGIGATDGQILVYDNQQLMMKIVVNQLSSVPFIILQNNHIAHTKYLRRIFFSMQELDDTLKINDNHTHNLSYTIYF